MVLVSTVIPSRFSNTLSMTDVVQLSSGPLTYSWCSARIHLSFKNGVGLLIIDYSKSASTALVL